MSDTRTPAVSTPADPSASPVAADVGGALKNGAAAVQDAATPMIDKARTFAQARPYATAALVGTIALAVINTLRGKRA